MASYADLLATNPNDFYTKTVTSQAEANALNARGAQQVGYTPSADGKADGSYLMRIQGKDPALLQQQLLGLMIQERDQGAAAQEKQYADIMANVNSLGATQSEALKRQYQQLGANTQQDMQSRGLINSTLAINADRGVQADYAFAQQALNDQLTRQRLDYMAARNISIPSLDQIGALALQAAQNPVGGAVPALAPTTPAVVPKQANPKANYFIPGVG